MQRSLQIGQKDLIAIQQESLADLASILKTGIVRVGEIGVDSFPISNVHGYLYLYGLKQRGNAREENRKEMLEFVDSLLVSSKSIQSTVVVDLSSDVAMAFLDKEIIEIIEELFPLIINRYRLQLDAKYNSKEQRANNHLKLQIEDKNYYAIGNVLNLCLATLLNQSRKMDYLQCLTLIKEILLPIYFCYSKQLDGKPILEAIKKSIAKHYSSHIQQQLSNLFTHFYHSYWSNIIFSNANTQHVNTLEKQLTLLEMIHFNISYPHSLSRSELFKSNIKGLLHFKGQSRTSIHPLAVKIYEKLAVCLNQCNTTSQVFIKLFNILSCYGSHLIKDVWQSFYLLIDTKQASIFSPIELIDIILAKLETHQNSNVIKNCLHQLLQNEQSNRIFENTPSIIYNSLIRMLNLGVHYLDCMFHMDSKMYPLISNFFLRFLNSPELAVGSLQQHLLWLFDAILSKSNYDHALIALMMVFLQQKKRTQFLTKDMLESSKYLLTSGYSRFPIRKRFQLIDSLLNLISNNINFSSITIASLFDYLIMINKQYFIEENINKLKTILGLFKPSQIEDWVASVQREVKEEIQENIKDHSYNWEGLYRKIQMIELYQNIYGVHLQSYHSFFAEMVLEYGESQYKSLQQRRFMIVVYQLIKDSLSKEITQSKYFVAHLEAILSTISLYSSLLGQNPEEICRKEVLQIIHHLFHRTYAYQPCESFKEREKERVVLARMLQWASDKMNNQELALDIILQACRARIEVLIEREKHPELYVDYENLFEETLYELYEEIAELEANPKRSEGKCSHLSKGKQLRLKVLLTTILTHDFTHTLSKHPISCSDIGDIIDRYDFQSYEEVCWLISSVYSKHSVSAKARSEEEAASLGKQLDLLLENMVNNLQYSLGKKEIVSICECAVTAMFNLAFSNGSFSSSLAAFAKKLIKSGQSYLIFQRSVSLLITQQLSSHFDRICTLNCEHLIPLLIDILSIQQYRGFDSAIYLYTQNLSYDLYLKHNSTLQANYYGAVPRFLFIFAFKQILSRINFSKTHLSFLDTIIHSAFEICMSLVVKEKMFLSGRNKLKLQMWQFLLIFPPSSMKGILGKERFEALVLRCIDSLGHNLISEVRYYSEMFLMRVLTDRQNVELITNEMLQSLHEGLLKSIGNINRTISYIVSSGILIKHLSQYSQSESFPRIKTKFIVLYNSLLTYVGCSVAYFRGLSQFFCLHKTTSCLQTKYVAILRENFMMDTDAERLMSKLSEIINSYIKDISTWQIQREVLTKIPNVNYNVVSEKYYMDVLKQFSTELAKINKNLDGFTAYRYIWKKNVGKDMDEESQQEEEGKGEDRGDKEQEDEDIFQRKIDPTLDHIYGEEHKSELTLMVTSAKSQALIGHLARTGEIFGIDELVLPCRKIIELDQFKSISVTAQRWLKINDLGAELGQKAKPQSIIKAFIRHKSEGYEVIKLSKTREGTTLTHGVKMPKKCVLLLDEQGLLTSQCLRLVDRQLQIGRQFSLHVEASIFIWSYFTLFINKCR